MVDADRAVANPLPDQGLDRVEGGGVQPGAGDAGLVGDGEDIDALFNAGLPGGTMQLGESVRIEPSVSDATQVGGASFEFHLQHATAAIAATGAKTRRGPSPLA